MGDPLTEFKKALESYDPSAFVVAVDFETYYDDDYSVAGSTYWHYCRDERFDAYLVSIYCPALGIEFVGDPADFDWNQISGMLWLAHNSPFDRAVWDRLVELAEPGSPFLDVQPMAWVNTADLAAYMHSPRSLAVASDKLLGRSLSKQVRVDMKGRRYRQLSGRDKGKWNEYALVDAICCYDLWDKYSQQWPLIEQQLSLHTSECVRRGVAVDLERVHQSIDVLKKAVLHTENLIPWANRQELTPKMKQPRFNRDGSPKLMKPTSPKQLALHAREQGVPVPSTTEAKSDEYQAWERQYGARLPVVAAIQQWRKCNRALKVFEQILSRVRDDGRMEIQICYYGAASTGRWAGRPGGGGDERGLNMQNLMKEKMHFNAMGQEVSGDDPDVDFDVDVRRCFVAGAGKIFGIADLAQIEPRVLAALAGDTAFLDEVRKGISPYEAHARHSMGWTGGPLKKSDPDQYAFSKARVLSLGYGAGFLKFISMAAMYVGPSTFDKIFKSQVTPKQEKEFLAYLKYHPQGVDITRAFPGYDRDYQNTLVNAWLQVTDYRTTNPLITKFWKRMEHNFQIACSRKEDWHLNLPSGRKLSYYEPRKTDGGAARLLGGKRTHVYGGKVVENCIQAAARDVFGEGLIRLELAGYPVLWHVHDECIAEVPAQTDINDLIKNLAQAPSWMPDLPVEAEGQLSPYYLK